MTRLPHFICAGFEKTGTTWLNHCLREHPDVLLAGRNRVHFFSMKFDKGLDWYAQPFKKTGAGKIRGDVSPTYASHPLVPKRIHDSIPNVRLVFILRDPVARAYSDYCMHLRAGKVPDIVDEVLKTDDPHRFVTDGLYFIHMSRFLKYFPRERIKIMIYDDFQKNPKTFLREIFDFLEIDLDFEPSILYRRLNKKRSRPRSQFLFKLYVQVTSAVMLNRWLSRPMTYIRTSRFSNLFHALNKGPDFPKPSPEHEAKMARYYQADIGKLSKWLGRDLNHWLTPYLEKGETF